MRASVCLSFPFLSVKGNVCCEATVHQKSKADLYINCRREAKLAAYPALQKGPFPPNDAHVAQLCFMAQGCGGKRRSLAARPTLRSVPRDEAKKKEKRMVSQIGLSGGSRSEHAVALVITGTYPFVWYIEVWGPKGKGGRWAQKNRVEIGANKVTWVSMGGPNRRGE